MECRLHNTTIYYKSIGKGRPILTLHGWMTDHRYMSTLLEPALADREGWRRIDMDIPGHGRTAGPEAIYSSDDVLDIILEFIDKEIQGQRFAIAGTSYGSILARGVVARRGSEIDGLSKMNL